jgi:phage/plasmid-like protein (TIGR03299 family)
MAALLDVIEQPDSMVDGVTGMAGKKAMFAVGGDVWHDPENTVAIDSAPTFEAAMNLGGLNFQVELQAMKAMVKLPNGGTMEVDVPENRAVVRMDRNEVLGVVGPSYHVLQNLDAFRVLEPLVDAGIASLETGGSLRGGRDVWMMVKFNVDSDRVRAILKDEVLPYALISNNHNGARKVTLQETPIRVVCKNTLNFALRDLSKAVTVRHTANVKARTVDAAAELFGNVTRRYEVIADQYASLKATVLSEAQFERLVLDIAAPLPGAPKERKDNIAKAAFEKATARAEAKRDRLTQLWTTGDGHTGDLSAWEAYNGAIQSLDHDADMWGAKNRLESLFDGGLAKTKQEVVESLVEYSLASAGLVAR